jgi:hypothetical protein
VDADVDTAFAGNGRNAVRYWVVLIFFFRKYVLAAFYRRHQMSTFSRAILAALFTLVVAAPGFAQGVATFGAKAGVNFADVSVDPADEGCCDMKTGLAIGGFVDIGIRNAVSFQPEVLYMQKGAKFEEDGIEAKAHIDSVQIPLLVKFNFQTEGQARPFAVFGPGLGFISSAKFKAEGFEDEDFKDELETLDFSLIFGGGVTVRNFIIEARYDLGLNNIQKDEDGSLKSRTFTLLFGYGFSR